MCGTANACAHRGSHADYMQAGRTACAHTPYMAGDQCKHACRQVAAQDRLDLTWPWKIAPSLLHGPKHVRCCLLHGADLILGGLVGWGACTCWCWLQQRYSAELPAFKARPGLVQGVGPIPAAHWHAPGYVCCPASPERQHGCWIMYSKHTTHLLHGSRDIVQGWTFNRCCMEWGTSWILKPRRQTLNPIS